LAAWPTARADEMAQSKTLVLTGTVASLYRVDTSPSSTKNWSVSLHVEKVKKGRYSEPTFTFRVHSPARAGLKLGSRYTIDAAWTGQEYEVSERNIKAEVAKR
jgi:hypothetical protein